MSRLADLQHLPGMTPGCFLTLHQGQIQAKHTLASTERKHGCRVPVEAKTSSDHRFDPDTSTQVQVPWQNSAAQTNHSQISAAVQCLHYKSSLSHLSRLSVWEGTHCSTREGSSLIVSWACRTCAAGHQAETKATTTLTLSPHLLHDSRGSYPVPANKPRCTSDTSHLHPSLIPVQRAAALLHMDLSTLFGHIGCIRVKNKLPYFAVNPKHHRASRRSLKDSGLHSPLSCVTDPFKISIKVLIRIRTFKVPSPKIHTNSNILHIRQEVTLGQGKGPHLACGVTWQGKEPRHWAPHPAAPRERWNLRVLSHGSQIQLPPAHRVTRGKLQLRVQTGTAQILLCAGRVTQSGSRAEFS